MIARVRIEIGDGVEDLDVTISQARDIYEELSKIFRDPQSQSKEKDVPGVAPFFLHPWSGERI